MPRTTFCFFLFSPAICVWLKIKNPANRRLCWSFVPAGGEGGRIFEDELTLIVAGGVLGAAAGFLQMTCGPGPTALSRHRDRKPPKWMVSLLVSLETNPKSGTTTKDTCMELPARFKLVGEPSWLD